MIENRQLRYFITAAHYLHITQAAEALHIAQPALTRNIHQIEEELGVALFHRAHKRISLTEAGKTFLAEAERTLQQLKQSVVAAQKAARGELGKLVIGFVGTAGLVAVPKLVSAFHQRYPEPKIVLSELEPARLETALRNGTIDVALLYGSYTDDELAVRLLESDHLAVVLPSLHRLAKRTRVNLRDLADEDFIMPSRATGGGMVDHILEECRHAGFRPKTGNEISTATIQSTMGLVSAGMGVSLLPSALRPFSRKGVIFRPIREASVTLYLNMVWRPQGASAVLRNFLATVP
jgi:DNA-binding transcriptional LysR family regulator